MIHLYSSNIDKTKRVGIERRGRVLNIEYTVMGRRHREICAIFCKMRVGRCTCDQLATYFSQDKFEKKYNAGYTRKQSKRLPNNRVVEVPTYGRTCGTNRTDKQNCIVSLLSKRLKIDGQMTYTEDAVTDDGRTNTETEKNGVQRNLLITKRKPG